MQSLDESVTVRQLAREISGTFVRVERIEADSIVAFYVDFDVVGHAISPNDRSKADTLHFDGMSSVSVPPRQYFVERRPDAIVIVDPEWLRSGFAGNPDVQDL